MQNLEQSFQAPPGIQAPEFVGAFLPEALARDPGLLLSTGAEIVEQSGLVMPPTSSSDIESVPLVESSRVEEDATSLLENGPKLENGFSRLSNGMNFLRTTEGAIETNIPPGSFQIIERKGKRNVVNFPPASLDRLPIGEYWLAGKSYGSNMRTSVLSVHEDVDSGDRYFRAKRGSKYSMDDDPIVIAWEASKGISSDQPDLLGQGGIEDFIAATPDILVTSHKKLFKEVGFITEPNSLGGETVVGFPTPETLKRKAETWGVSIKLVDASDDNGVIPLADYVGAFSEGSYPVGIAGSLSLYKHDVISDDHFAGVLGGGQVMLDALKPIAQKAQALDPSNQGGILMAIGKDLDSVTSLVTNSLANALNGQTGKTLTGQLESKYKEMCEAVGIEYQEGAFSTVVLKGFVSTGKRIGWSESTLQKLEAQAEQFAVAA